MGEIRTAMSKREKTGAPSRSTCLTWREIEVRTVHLRHRSQFGRLGHPVEACLGSKHHGLGRNGSNFSPPLRRCRSPTTLSLFTHVSRKPFALRSLGCSCQWHTVPHLRLHTGTISTVRVIRIAWPHSGYGRANNIARSTNNSDAKTPTLRNS
jgi:hypothetical protein